MFLPNFYLFFNIEFIRNFMYGMFSRLFIHLVEIMTLHGRRWDDEHLVLFIRNIIAAKIESLFMYNDSTKFSFLVISYVQMFLTLTEIIFILNRTICLCAHLLLHGVIIPNRCINSLLNILNIFNNINVLRSYVVIRQLGLMGT